MHQEEIQTWIPAEYSENDKYKSWIADQVGNDNTSAEIAIIKKYLALGEVFF